jgi:hypothetical protein
MQILLDLLVFFSIMYILIGVLFSALAAIDDEKPNIIKIFRLVFVWPWVLKG